MAVEIKLPRLGQGMEAGTIVKWLKAEGDRVEKGEPLYEVDTEKVTQEVEAEAEGVLLRIAVPEGEVPVGATIGWIGQPGEEIPAQADGGRRTEPEARAAAAVSEAPPEEPAPAQEPVEARAPAVPPPAPAPTPPSGRIKASPLARRIAREREIDLAAIAGTGPEGRIVAEDVERAAAAAAAPAAAPVPAPPPGEVVVEKLSTLRKTIARRLTQAWEAPAFQISMSADTTRAAELHAKLLERTREGEPRPTLTDILTKVCAVALMRHREVNALFREDAIELHPAANIGIAVATPKGLVVPVIRGCERLSLSEVAAARAALVEKAREGRLEREDLEGGTFTISNLGMFGVEQFVAVLNPPQVAILAVGAAEARPVARGGEVVVLPMMTLTLTCDHRALDGAAAADFLRSVTAFLEEPGLAL